VFGANSLNSIVLSITGSINASNTFFNASENLIREQNYIGKVVYVIPKVGLINLATGRTISYMSIGLIAIVLVLYFRKISKEKEKNQ
jgi:hypothetical protein